MQVVPTEVSTPLPSLLGAKQRRKTNQLVSVGRHDQAVPVEIWLGENGTFQQGGGQWLVIAAMRFHAAPYRTYAGGSEFRKGRYSIMVTCCTSASSRRDSGERQLGVSHPLASANLPAASSTAPRHVTLISIL